MEKKLQNNLVDECLEIFNKLKIQFCNYIEDKLFGEIKFDYIDEVEVRDANAKLTENKLFFGQVFKFNFKNNEIIIEDYKKLEGSFSRIKRYGPYAFEDLGFTEYNESLFIIKLIAYLEICGEDTTYFYNYPKFIIANKDFLCYNSSKDISLNNLFTLWKIDVNHYHVLDLKELENQMIFMFSEKLKSLAEKDIVNKDLVTQYFSLLNLLNKN